MKTFLTPLKNLKEYELIKDQIKNQDEPVQVTGCIDSQKIHFMDALSDGYQNKVIITFSELKAKEILDDFKFFDRDALLYPAKDFIFFSADVHGNLMVKQRLEVIKRLIEKQNTTIITTIDGLMDKILPLEVFEENVLQFCEGEAIDLDTVKESLIKLGYERLEQVDMAGQFAIRGSILDIFPLTEEVPYRIDLWDTEIDSIRTFDTESQRSIDRLNQVKIYPASEFILNEKNIGEGVSKIREEEKKYEASLRKQMKTEEAHRIKTITNEFLEQIGITLQGLSLDSYVNYFFEKTVSLLEYFGDNTIFFLDEPSRLSERCETVEAEFQESMIHRLEKGYLLPSQTNVLAGSKELFAGIQKKKSVLFTTLEQKVKSLDVSSNYHIDVKNINPYHNSFELLVKDLKQYKKAGYSTLLLSGSRTRAARLAENLRENELTAFYTDDTDRELKPGEIVVQFGNIHKGFEYPLIKFVVITESDIFGAEKKKRRKKTTYEGRKIQSFTELNIGDYVVHENHGLGIYRGIEKIEVDKIAKDYIKIEYGGGGNLYILATQLDIIQKYAGADAKKPKLNKLGTQEWIKTKTRVRGAVKDIAKELVELYAVRQAKEGFQFNIDTVWQREFEELFPYDETDDQLTAIEATKRDMESKKIMDRLICGDVGYGKTEVAIRAAFKAIQDGKQVVFLVPTTILAQQHYNTFTQRMKDFPVRVELLSRFRTPAQQKKALVDLKKGFVDIVIGTHRVLSTDVEFKNLGLLIIDEEQRFGVTHKEKMKRLKENIDVLTLTATPIPRTLHMSLIGIRDMSVLEEPPVDRVPIQTFVMEYNDEMVREAINRELVRGGQVYYVYNRVNNIDEIANQIAKLVPEATVSFAHGQMSERQLERIMYDFINGDIDVLVSTTIIETGLDISNVNTMIIHDADQLGLSQLYQLRGRVGRSNRTAYAFLMYKRDKMLKEIAEKRLQAIREFTELGSGFKIAMRDLEIRGAGNILGAEQHGHMEAVGYDLYCKMLNEAVQVMKGVDIPDDFETTVELDADAYIPPTYIKNEYQKLDIYKRIAGIETQDEYEDMQDELMDRFGEMPKSVVNLLSVALMKSLAHKSYITEVSADRKQIKLIMYRFAKVDVNKIPEFIGKYGNKLKFTVETNPYFQYTPSVNEWKDAEDLIEFVKKLLGDIQMLMLT